MQLQKTLCVIIKQVLDDMPAHTIAALGGRLIMPVIQEREPVTVETVMDDGGPESFIAAILGLIVIAVLGYMIYAFNANAPTAAPEMNAPTVTQPLTPPQTPAPLPPPVLR